jgi:hypothetical protein
LRLGYANVKSPDEEIRKGDSFDEDLGLGWALD